MEDQEIIEIKVAHSKLFERVRLAGAEKPKLLARAKQLFNEIIQEEAETQLALGNKPKQFTQEQKDRLLELYNLPNIKIEEIMACLQLDIFQLVSALCLPLWDSNTASGQKKINLTKIVAFLELREYTIIRLVNILLADTKQAITMIDLTKELYVVPQQAILMLTMIWAEVECRDIALLFEPYLNNPPAEEPVTDEQMRKIQEECDKLLDMHLQLYSDDRDRELNEMQEQFDKNMEEAFEIIEGQSAAMKGIINEVKSLKDIVSRIPEHAYCIETVVSDSESSSEDVDDEIFVLVKLTQKWPHWLEQELSDANLGEHIYVEPDHWFFAPVAEIFGANLDPIIVAQGYVKCRVLQKENTPNGQFVTVQGIRPPGTMDAISSIRNTISSNHLAMGDAPSIRCQEGTRVVALCEQSTESIDHWEIKYFAGTIGVQPLSHNRYEYLVFFDNGPVTYVKPADIRLMVDQPKDEHGKLRPRQAHIKIPPKYQPQAEFIHHYLHSYPDWPLIQLKKSENTQRILATRDGQNESAFVLDVDRQLALLRFPGTSKVGWPTEQNTPGIAAKDCVVVGCKEHVHIDEWVYRGSTSRFPALRQARQPNPIRTSVAQSSNFQNLQQFPRQIRKLHPQFEMALPPSSMGISQSIQCLRASMNNKQTARKTTKKPQYDFQRFPTSAAGQENPEMTTKKKLATHVKEEKIDVRKWDYTNSGVHHKLAASGKFMCKPACRTSQEWTDCKNVFAYQSPYAIPLSQGWTRLISNNQNKQFQTINLISDSKTRARKKKILHRKRVQYIAPCGIHLNTIEQVVDYLRVTAERELTIDMFCFDPQVRPNVRIKLENVKMEDFAVGQEAIKIPLVNVVDDKPAPKMAYRPKRTLIKKMVGGNNQQASGSATVLQVEEQDIEREFCAGCSCTDNCADNERCECRKLTVEAQERLDKSLRVEKPPVGYHFRQLKEKHISGIYECNPRCPCSKNLCFNRVVQQDLKTPLQLFMTANKGWGVRTLVDIPEGTFVCTYSGELLDEALAEEQGKQSGDLYLTDLDLIKVVESEKDNMGIDLIGDEGYGEECEGGGESPGNVATMSEDEAFNEPTTSQQQLDELSEFDQRIQALEKKKTAPKRSANRKASHWKLEDIRTYFQDNMLFVIDAAKTGNIGRFLNHSCDPNCQVQNVFVDTHDLRLPWCTFFTTKFVKAGEELTWDYRYEFDSAEDGKQIDCQCEAKNCRGRFM